MKLKTLAAALAATVIAGSAFAADLPSRKVAPAYIAPAPVLSWTGFYIGADIGGAWSNQTAVTTPFAAPGFGLIPVGGAGIAGFGNLPTNHGGNKSGVIGGLYAGYNMQFNMFVLGLEADISLKSKNSGSDTQAVLATFGAPTPAYTMNVTSGTGNWLATARARAGLALGPALIYATGGAAWTTISGSATAGGLVAAGINTVGQFANVTWSNTKTGFVVGGGLEWMFSPNWTLRGEYLYHQFAGSSASMPLLGVAAGGGNTCIGGGGANPCGWNVSTSKVQLHTARIGVAYKFGGAAGPVVAKY